MKGITVVVLMLVMLPSSLAWGEWGHKMIAQIAQQMLNPTASSIVTDFIGWRDLADIAPIPDEYDHTAQGDWSKPCHYINMPKDALNFTYPADCPGLCVVRSIFNYTNILKQEQTNPNPCSFGYGDEPCALTFLVHFVGDVHQPLHVGYAYDEGGNTVNVSWYGNQTHLHPVWDTLMIEKWVANWYDGFTDLASLMQNETQLVKYYSSIKSPISWADESFHYVRSTCYNFTDNGLETEEPFSMKIKINEAKRLQSQMRNADKEPYIGDKYYDTNLPIVKQRLIAAGVRLGNLLNEILTGSK